MSRLPFVIHEALRLIAVCGWISFAIALAYHLAPDRMPQ